MSVNEQVARKEAIKHYTEEAPTHAHHHVSEKLKFFSGEETNSSLPLSAQRRVRELQTGNKELQRQIAHLKHECSLSSDPLHIMNEIENANSTVAKNAGEILNIFTQNEKRLARIAELEKQNINLQQEITDNMAAFASISEQDKKSGFASGYYSARSTYENNLATLHQLKSAS